MIHPSLLGPGAEEHNLLLTHDIFCKSGVQLLINRAFGQSCGTFISLINKTQFALWTNIQLFCTVSTFILTSKDCLDVFSAAVEF